MTTGRVAVEQEVEINAPIATVYSYLTDPALVVQWMGRAVELDARPGGGFRCEMNDRDIFRGEVVELVPNARVVFTFGWEAVDSPIPPGASTVEITLREESGKTLVRLVHRDVPEPAAEIHGQGWRLYLDRLAVAAAGGDPGPDPNATPGSME